MPLIPQVTLQPFEKWAIDFVGQIQPPVKKMSTWYIITTTEYLTRWAKAHPVKDCIGVTATKFIFEYVLTRFGCPNILMRTTCKKLIRQTHFILVYGVEFMMPMEYIVPSLRIAEYTRMADHRALEERLVKLTKLEEDRFLVGFHQQVQKEHEKAWHNQHIKLHTFKVNDLVLLYDKKFDKFRGKFRMQWLGLYVIKEITNGGAVQLIKLNGEPFPGKVNGN
eukprot:PITA_09643